MHPPFGWPYEFTGVVINKYYFSFDAHAELKVTLHWHDKAACPTNIFAAWQEEAVLCPLGDILIGDVITIFRTKLPGDVGLLPRFENPHFLIAEKREITTEARREINQAISRSVQSAELFCTTCIQGKTDCQYLNLEDVLLPE